MGSQTHVQAGPSEMQSEPPGAGPSPGGAERLRQVCFESEVCFLLSFPWELKPVHANAISSPS